jgi:hypothetical protein
MRKSRVKNNIFVVARKSVKGNKLDYYMQMPDGRESYMFTKNYSMKCYQICRSGVPINRILGIRRRNPAVMKLVNYTNFMMPYFIEYFELETVA